MHEMAGVGAKRDEVLGVKFTAGVLRVGQDVVNLKIVGFAARHARGLALEMLGADPRPFAGSSVDVGRVRLLPGRQESSKESQHWN